MAFGESFFCVFLVVDGNIKRIYVNIVLRLAAAASFRLNITPKMRIFCKPIKTMRNRINHY